MPNENKNPGFHSAEISLSRYVVDKLKPITIAAEYKRRCRIVVGNEKGRSDVDRHVLICAAMFLFHGLYRRYNDTIRNNVSCWGIRTNKIRSDIMKV